MLRTNVMRENSPSENCKSISTSQIIPKSFYILKNLNVANSKSYVFFYESYKNFENPKPQGILLNLGKLTFLKTFCLNFF